MKVIFPLGFEPPWVVTKDNSDFLKKLMTEYSGFQQGDLVVLNPNPHNLKDSQITKHISVPLEKLRTHLDPTVAAEYYTYRTIDPPILYLGYKEHAEPDDIDIDHYFLHQGQVWVLPSYVQDAFFYLEEDPGGQKKVLKPWFLLATKNK